MKIPRYIVGLSAIGAFYGGYILLKDSSGGPKYEGDEKLTNKTVIITGATSGIGRVTAEKLALRGGRIILACRDMDKCDQVRKELIKTTSNQNLFCRNLDLSSIESIKKFAQEFNREEERLDVLINNAGVLKKERTVTKDGFETQLGVNFLGRFLLTNLLLDKMKATQSYGRIINVVCIGYSDSWIAFDDFNHDRQFYTKRSSKMASLANVLFTADLAERTKGSNVGVYAVNPGLSETDLRKELGPHRSLLSKYILKPLWASAFKLPHQACQTIIHCVLSPSLERNDEMSGKVFRECEEEMLDPKIYSKRTMARLWAVAEHWTRLDETVSSSSTISPPPLVESSPPNLTVSSPPNSTTSPPPSSASLVPLSSTPGAELTVKQ